jgi:hypothetical protein
MNALPTRASTKHLRADVTAIPYKRLLLLVQRRHHCRKALAASHRVGVVGAQAGLKDRQGALVQGAGAGQVALVGQDAGEDVEAFGGVGVVGAQAGLADGQGALVQAAGGVEVALVGQDDGEVAQAGDGVTASTSGV